MQEIAAASVTVAIPVKIRPKIITGISIAQIESVSVAAISFADFFGCLGKLCRLPYHREYTRNAAVQRTAGVSVARNSFCTDAFVRLAYTISVIEGGIRGPSREDAEASAAA